MDILTDKEKIKELCRELEYTELCNLKQELIELGTPMPKKHIWLTVKYKDYTIPIKIFVEVITEYLKGMRRK